MIMFRGFTTLLGSWPHLQILEHRGSVFLTNALAYCKKRFYRIVVGLFVFIFLLSISFLDWVQVGFSTCWISWSRDQPTSPACSRIWRWSKNKINFAPDWREAKTSADDFSPKRCHIFVQIQFQFWFTWAQCCKTFYGRNLPTFIIN